MKHGSRLLAELDDISRYASLLFSDVQFDLGKRTITATAYIQNTSNITLVDPVKVRILRLYSRLGVPELMNSDNKRCGAGAVFDFSESVRGHVLKPGQNSDGRQITIHFNHLDFSAPPLEYRVLETALTLDAVVLGKESRLSTGSHHESAKLP
jgi:hypothetical protein